MPASQYNPTPSSGILTEGDSHTCSYPALGRRAPPHWRYRVFVSFCSSVCLTNFAFSFFILFTENSTEHRREWYTPRTKGHRAQSAATIPTTHPQVFVRTYRKIKSSPVGAGDYSGESRIAWITRAQGVVECKPAAPEARFWPLHSSAACK